MRAPAPLWAVRPEAAALEEAGEAVEPAGVPPVWVVLPVWVLPAGAEALPPTVVEALARVNGMEWGVVAVPVGVI
jgi:hypothetical protein